MLERTLRKAVWRVAVSIGDMTLFIRRWLEERIVLGGMTPFTVREIVCGLCVAVVVGIEIRW